MQNCVHFKLIKVSGGSFPERSRDEAEQRPAYLCNGKEKVSSDPEVQRG